MRPHKDISEYADLIGMQRPVSKKHPPMPRLNRAAQFAPFAALTGYEELIGETARFTSDKAELSEEERERIGRKLTELAARSAERPFVAVTHYVPDPFKEGGSYEVTRARLKKVDPQAGVLVLETGARIPFGDIRAVSEDQTAPEKY
ncbi:MAG: hypothetical protein Q4C53_06430 [Clostridia bacterium]|nr:hypothetical protein [Clostridia bacterium]